MGYLKRDGTPRHIPEHYWGIWEKVNSKVRKKAKKSKATDVKKMRDNFRKSAHLRPKTMWKRRKAKEMQVLEDALSKGTLDEVNELITAVKDSDLPPGVVVYSKSGEVIPLSSKAKDYDAKLGEEVCEKIRNGETVSTLNKAGIITVNKFRKWYRSVPDFKRMADEAELERSHLYFDKINQLITDVENQNIGTKEAQFIADQCKWILERLNPKFMQKSGKQELNVNMGEDGKVQFNIMLAPTNAQN